MCGVLPTSVSPIKRMTFTLAMRSASDRAFSILVSCIVYVLSLPRALRLVGNRRKAAGWRATGS